MAEELDDGEFWLPSQFLTDDDILVDFKSKNTDTRTRRSDIGIYFGTYSGLSSPVSSTETEIDEEEYIAVLTRKMAHSTLQNESGLGYDNSKTWPLSGSPQSTLSGLTSGCGCRQGSSRGSPNCHSRVTSPPGAVAGNLNNGSPWDVLYAAAGEVARMRMVEEGSGPYIQNRGGGVVGPPRKPSPVPLSSIQIPIPNQNLGFHSNQSLSYQQLQLAQFQQLKQQQMLKQQEGWGHSNPAGFQQNQTHQMVQNRARNNGRRPPGLSPSDWPTLQQSQQQTSSDMTAVFLPTSGPKRQCTGTGVFLPRPISSQTDPLKRPGSAVLVPDRVVQALNLKLDAMDDVKYSQRLKSRHNNGPSTPDYDAALKFRNEVLMARQKRNVRNTPTMNQELRLPPWWTC